MTEPRSEEAKEDAARSFEDIVAAALKVDPRGIAGKHRREKPDAEKAPPPK